ncbi:hypothetical protein B2J88_41115 [Rhodococcus sp. SRB_17]|nr:hypothetical protein [Rhodococcus sp. SRB_17]
MWVTVYAERRWVVSPKRFRRIENLPIGTAIMVGHGDGRALDPLAGSGLASVASNAAAASGMAR